MEKFREKKKSDQPKRQKIIKKEKPEAATVDLFSQENIEAEQAHKKWLEDNPDLAFTNEERFLPKVPEGPGMFSSENKEAVQQQNEEARKNWDNIKNAGSQSENVNQEELSNQFFGKDKTPAEIAESDKVSPAIKSRFNNAVKIVGNDRTRVLPDGSSIKGKYVLLDANAITPSHDPNKAFRSSEGFPMLEDGRNPNDRDYTQKDVSGKVLQRANKYDGQAVENVPTVDKNGIVIDGNDRTMAGQIAAKNSTDKAYLDVLRDNAANFGFGRAQVDAMIEKGMHPRVVFVPDAIVPYDTETFAKFNPRTQGKVKNAIENAITLGRTAPDELVDRLGTIMDGYETTSKFFNSPVAMKDVRALLERYKIVNSDNVNEFFDTPSSMTANGKELLQNLMLGKTFGEEELRLLQNHRDVREKMIYSMNNILAIESLGDQYSLKGYFDEVLHLWDVVEHFKEQNGLKSMSQAYELYLQQGNLHGETYSPESRILFNELDSVKKSSLREFTKAYLTSAKDYALTGPDIFGNAPKSKQELINDYYELQKQQQQLAELARKANAEQPVGSAANEGERTVPEGSGGQEANGQTELEGNTDTATESGSEQNPNRVGGIDYSEPEDNSQQVLFETTPEYGKEDTTPLPTPEQQQETKDAYSAAIEAFNKHNANEAKVQAKIDRLESDIDEMKRNRETGTDAYREAVKNLDIQRAVKK